MSHPVVLRFTSISPKDLSAIHMHGARAGGDLDHVDIDRTSENETLIGGSNWVQKIKADINQAKAQNLSAECEALAFRKRKKDLEARRIRGLEDPWKSAKGGPMREAILTANSAFFADQGFSDFQGAAFWDPEKVDAFKQCGQRFFAEHFPGQVVHLRLDLDEEAPHFHAVIVPWTEKTSARRGTQRLIQPSSNPLLADYEKAQDVAGAFFANLGLSRGRKRAEERREAQEGGLPTPELRKHLTPSQYRAQKAQQLLTDMKRAKKVSAAADEKLSAAEQREQEAAAFERGVEALIDDELIFQPIRPSSTEGYLAYGVKAPQEKSLRVKLAQAIRPAQEKITAFARKFFLIEQKARHKMDVEAKHQSAALEEREAALIERENQVGKDADVISETLKIIGKKRPEIEKVRTRLRARGR